MMADWRDTIVDTQPVVPEASEAKPDWKSTIVSTVVVDPKTQTGKNIAAKEDLESSGAAAARGAYQGLTLGMGDEGAAGIRTAAREVPKALSSLKDEAVNFFEHPLDSAAKEFAGLGNADASVLDRAKADISGEYDRQLAAQRARDALALNANPALYAGTDAAGGLLTTLAGGRFAKAPGALANGLSAATDVIGHSDEKGLDTLAGAAGLGAGAALLPVIGKGLGAVAGKIPDTLKTILPVAELVGGHGAKGVVEGAAIKAAPVALPLIGKIAAPLVGPAYGALHDLEKAKLTDAQKEELYKQIADAEDDDPREAALKAFLNKE